MISSRDLRPPAASLPDVLADLFGSADFPAEIPDPEKAAEIVIQRLIESGFAIKAQED